MLQFFIEKSEIKTLKFNVEIKPKTAKLIEKFEEQLYENL